MVALPGLNMNANPYLPTATGGIAGGGSPFASGVTAPPSGGFTGGGAAINPLANYNPFPNGAPTFGGGGGAGAAGAGAAPKTWTADNLPGGGLPQAAPATYTPPATPGQSAVANAIAAAPPGAITAPHATQMPIGAMPYTPGSTAPAGYASVYLPKAGGQTYNVPVGEGNWQRGVS